MAQVIPMPEPGARRNRPAAGIAGDRCRATTASGGRCRNRAVEGSGFCRAHLPAAPGRIGPFDADRVQEALAYMRRRLTGDYEVDEFGFDAELTERVLLPAVRLLYRRYWRAEWIGLENVPSKGPALLVGNHAGVVPLDAVVMKFGVLGEHPARRHVRLLAADLVFRTMFMAPLARKSGNTLACEEDAHRLLSRGELVGVFPEGFKGVGKPFRERYRLQRFGRGGFIEIALRTRAPIVPVSIVGSEEIYPMIGNAKPLARLAGLPYFPITPLFPWLGPLGALPLPSKWIVEFGEPIPTDGYGAEAHRDAMLVFELTDRVRDIIQQTLHRNLIRRDRVYL